MQHDTSELPQLYCQANCRTCRATRDSKTLAELSLVLLFPVSHRSLEIWPLKWRFVNGHAVAETYEALAHAWHKFNSAPSMMKGRGRSRATRHSKLSHGDADRETAA